MEGSSGCLGPDLVRSERLPLAAQTQLAGAIAGAARDTSGAVLPGVTVEASSPALIEKVRSAVTDAQGLYRSPTTPGQCSVTRWLASALCAEMGLSYRRIYRECQRRPAVGSLEETITVTGTVPSSYPYTHAKRRSRRRSSCPGKVLIPGMTVAAHRAVRRRRRYSGERNATLSFMAAEQQTCGCSGLGNPVPDLSGWITNAGAIEEVVVDTAGFHPRAGFG